MDPRLIDEIIARVAAKLAAAGEPVCDCDKPKLLILTQEHGTTCHDLLECGELKEKFRTECALLNEYQVDVDSCEAVVLYQLTCDALAKLASGMCDTPYTKLAAQAILKGKRVYVAAEEVELYSYAETAPKAYYAMMKEKLDLLMASGVTVCAQCDLVQAILGDEVAPAPAAPVCKALPAAPAERPRKEMRVDKRVLTERDVSEAAAAQYTCIRVSHRCILTDLAKDYAKAHGLCLIKE